MDSQLYHMVRGQLIIKVCVIFNMLEVLDWLCSAFGRDILDTLLSKASFFLHHAYDYVQPALVSPGAPTARLQWHKVAQLGSYVIIAAVYMFVHSMVLFCYMAALSVAINSYSYSLLTLLLSNRCAEIKSSPGAPGAASWNPLGQWAPY
ncbi:hypothetical protein H4R35_006184 [Dimargaris xerosporica]|nr:hypothetical protein H4R35_006184 [Dimargaris xerosporica]